MTTKDPMTSDVRAEMDAFQAAWGNGSEPRTAMTAPAFLFEDSPKVKALKVASLLKAREELRDEMVAKGVTRPRLDAMVRYNDQLIGLGWTPSL